MAIRTFDERIAGKWVEDANGCHVWTGTKNSDGYGELRIADKLRKAHRLRYSHTFGPIPPWLKCCHRCNNRACINPEHIYLGTDQDNANDSKKAGTHLIKAKGVEHHNTTLTEEDVLELRFLERSGAVSRAYLAKQFGVTTATVSNIVNRKTWGHI